MRKILELSAGDFVAKVLYFLASVYLARILGVTGFGVLEFANSLLMYFLLLSNAGLEGWLVREIARTGDVRGLVARVTVLRFVTAGAAFALLLAILPLLPDQPSLRSVLTLLGLCLFAQAASLKWAFLGQQKMRQVATGMVVSQIVFAGAVFAFVRSPAVLIWVPVLRLAGDLALAGYFGWRFAKEHGGLRLRLRLRGAQSILGPALTLGASAALSIVNYNFDAVLLGFVVGTTAVGLYGAAYKPVTVALAMPMTYFSGLYPALASSYAHDQQEFRKSVSQSLRLATSLSVPLGVGGVLLADPIIGLLFGPAYAPSVPVLQILAWSVVLVILRGTFRQALIVADRSGVELRCAMVSAGSNVALNLALIPAYGMIGAATATLVAEIVWVALVVNRVNHYVIRVNLFAYLWRPALAGAAMAACLWFAQPIFWMARATIGVGVYLGVLLLLGGANWREWKEILKRPTA